MHLDCPNVRVSLSGHFLLVERKMGMRGLGEVQEKIGDNSLSGRQNIDKYNHTYNRP